jgi:imidazolonepropionase-like amidohydrolase
MPGLIDCHVHVIAAHLNLNVTANQPNVFATLRALPIMKGMLMRGFTTVRDAGGRRLEFGGGYSHRHGGGPAYFCGRPSACRKPVVMAMVGPAVM